MTDKPKNESESYEYKIELRLGMEYVYRDGVLVDIRNTTLKMIVTDPVSFIPVVYIPKDKHG